MPSFSSSTGNGSDYSNKETQGSDSTVGTGLTATALMGLSNTTGLDTLSALLGSADGSSLTSSEGDALSSLSSISSLLSGDGSLSSLSLTQGNSSSTNYILLSQIIDKLNDISAKLEGASDSASPSKESDASTSSLAASTSESVQASSVSNKTSQQRELLRFRINGYDILSSLTEVYISKPEEDGAFLVVGDRTYTADYKKRTETFYMFFTFQDSEMNVSVKVLQDYENQNSFLYRLSQLPSLKAIKTGKLVSLLVNNPSFKVDMLLNLD